jgi:hypothetical protein
MVLILDTILLSTRVSLKDDKMNFRRSLEPDLSRSNERLKFIILIYWDMVIDSNLSAWQTTNVSKISMTSHIFSCH